jgi:hypothetical protein
MPDCVGALAHPIGPKKIRSDDGRATGTANAESPSYSGNPSQSLPTLFPILMRNGGHWVTMAVNASKS